MKSHTKRKSGFTLLEVIVSSVVLVIVFLSSLEAIQQSFAISSLQRDITLAGQIAQSKIEDLRLTPWANLSTANGNFNVSQFGNGIEPTILSRFTANCSVVGQVGRTDSFDRVIITVNWTSLNGQPHVRRYETLMGKFGLSDYFVSNHSVL